MKRKITQTLRVREVCDYRGCLTFDPFDCKNLSFTAKLTQMAPRLTERPRVTKGKLLEELKTGDPAVDAQLTPLDAKRVPKVVFSSDLVTKPLKDKVKRGKPSQKRRTKRKKRGQDCNDHELEEGKVEDWHDDKPVTKKAVIEADQKDSSMTAVAQAMQQLAQGLQQISGATAGGASIGRIEIHIHLPEKK